MSASSLVLRKSQKEPEIEYPRNSGDYELIGEPIGKGGSAMVHLARCKPLNTLVAVKLVDLEELSSSLELLIKEAHTMKGLRHPNVLPLHCSFVADSALWLVMPYIGGGNVSQLLRSQYPKGMEEDMILTIAKDILHGLQYLHSHDLAHRDLKAENLLVAEDGRIMLADFGATAKLEHARYSMPSVHLSDSSNSLSAASDGDSAVQSSGPSSEIRIERAGSSWSKYLSRQTFVGTPNYMAPEIMVQAEEGYNQSADIWSFGMVLLEMARGRVPLAGCSFTKIILDTVHGDAPSLSNCGCTHRYSKVWLLPKAELGGIVQALESMVAACLRKAADKRPSATQLLKDPVLRHGHDHKWLAKRLSGLDKSSRRASSVGDDSTAHSPASSSHSTSSVHTRHSLFSRHSSKTLPAAGSSQQHVDKGKTVHHLAWAFDLEGRPFVLVFELTQWFGKARIFMDGVELHAKRYTLLQQISWAGDKYELKVDNTGLGPLHGRTIKISVASHLGVYLLGKAMVDGRTLQAPIYCEHESLHTSTKSLSKEALLAVDSPLSPLDTKPSGDSVQSDMSPSASEVSLSPKPALQQVSLSPIPEASVPKQEQPFQPANSFSVPGHEVRKSPFQTLAREDDYSTPSQTAPGNSPNCLTQQPSSSADAMTSQKGHGADTLSYSNFDGPEASGTPDLTHHQTEPAELDAQVRMIVRQEVDAAVERLRKEFAERETMLIQAFEDRAEEERNQHERPHIAIRNGEH